MASRRSGIEEKAEAMLTPIAEENGVRVYDVEYVKEGADHYLRCYIDKDGGVNIGDCENVSRAMSDALDADDFIPDAYILEVSSPGLGRALTKDRHFEASLGEEVEGSTFRPYDEGKSKAFSGILKAYDKTSVTIGLQDEENGEGKELVLERKNISGIRLKLDF